MKTLKILISVIILLLVQTAHSVEFDAHGKLITPDKKAMQRANKQHKDGYTKLAVKYYKEAAKFGNNDAKYMIAMYHLSQKEWPRGYAWFNLMTAATEEQQANITQVQKLIKPEEKEAAAAIYKDLKKEYSPLVNLESRQRWARQDQTGSRIAGAPSIRSSSSYAPGRNASSGPIQPGAGVAGGAAPDGASIQPGESMHSQIQNYVYEFENTIGNVVLKDLELIESEDDQ
ncbi:hypothetical protein [Marinicella sp. W31]|uniref:hypothetical protein n=1 Tax=Marinicella sp. W31 TaxID=3023713 RepID=UPI003758370C